MWIMRSNQYNDMEPDAREKFVASVEMAGIKRRTDSESSEASSKGGEFFVVFDVWDKCGILLHTKLRAAVFFRPYP